MLQDLILDGGRHRVSLDTLQWPILDRGLGAPGFVLYYLAAQLQWNTFWLAGANLADLGCKGGSPDEVVLLARLLQCMPGRRIYRGIFETKLRCWRCCASHTTDHPFYAPSFPHGDPLSFFTAAQLAPWPEVGRVVVGNCYTDDTLMPLEVLVDTRVLPSEQFLVYEA
ncbi:hypothetical protein NDU88_004089 [Pleurodeles waltl]|uniref:Uncharacterized protein n=1 Tax=Pleurodeles waltl TaxID=8319 RepID=A0AAV7TT55_PLEWA|nr:hypothetical protein NDU88_004089 [Pleurodeles waltl]